MKRLFIFIFLVSCASSNLNNNTQDEALIFDDSLTFDEFNDLLIKYVEQAPYPNIDQQTMKILILLISLTSCSFQAEKNTLNIQYLKIKDLSHGEYKYLLNNDGKKKKIN